jgi:hypothetical protein
MIAPVTHIVPVTTFRRERILPVPGKILVRKGQKVSATDLVAQADLHAEHLLLDLARGLRVSPKQVSQYIQVQEGASIEKGDLLAGPVGFPARRVYAPRDGKIIMMDGGQALIELAGKPLQLKAGVPGEIAELVSDKGVIIEATGAVVQGVWGNGKVEFGLMSVLAKSPEHLLTPDQIDVSMRGAIVLGGRCENAEVLQNAEDLPLRGLILASMPGALAKVAQKLQLPVMLLEGFGARPMNNVAFKLLSTNDRREVALNAEAWNPLTGVRPEVVIPLPSDGYVAPRRDAETFAPQKQVRILRAPHASQTGVLLQLLGPSLLPSGLRAQAAEVRLESGENVIEPLANLEVIG